MSLSRMAVRIAVVGLVLVYACRPWDDAFNARVDAGFDDGDAGVADAGPSDAGTPDAGPVDAGCKGLCFVREVVSGDSIRGAYPMPGGSEFLATGFLFGVDSRANAQVVTLSPLKAQVKRVPQTRYISIFARAIVGAASDYWVAGTVGLFHVVDDTVIADDGVACGMDDSESWSGLTKTPRGDIWASGGFYAAVCHILPDGGQQLEGALEDAGVTDSLINHVVFDDAEQFYVGDYGTVNVVFPDAGVAKHTSGQADMAAVHGLSPNDVWSLSESGRVEHWDGTTWTNMPPVLFGTSPELGSRGLTLWVSEPNEVWVAGTGSTIVRWKNADWEAVQLPQIPTGDTSFDIKSISSHGTSDLLVAGSRNLPDGGISGFAWLYERK